MPDARATVTLLDARDVAQWTGRDRATVRQWVKRQRLKPSACDVRTRALLFDTDAVLVSLFATHPATG